MAEPMSALHAQLQDALAWVVKALEAEEQLQGIAALHCYTKANASLAICTSVLLPCMKSMDDDSFAESHQMSEYQDTAPTQTICCMGTDSLQVLDEVLNGLAQTYQQRIKDLQQEAAQQPSALCSPDCTAAICSHLPDLHTSNQYLPSQHILYQGSQQEIHLRNHGMETQLNRMEINQAPAQHGLLQQYSNHTTTTADDTRLSGTVVTHQTMQHDEIVTGMVSQCRTGLHGSLEDLAGMQKLKQELKQALLLPIKMPHLFTGMRQAPRTFLFHGPPGTGKTMLVEKAAAEAGLALLSLSPSAVLSKWSGDSEKIVRAAFQAARIMAPCAIFVDEIDSLAPQRGSSGSSEPAANRLLTELLLQLNSLQGSGMTSHKDSNSRGATTNVTATDNSCHKTGKESIKASTQRGAQHPQTVQDCGVYFLAATNRIQDCDVALLRRFHRRFHVPLPDASERQAFWEMALQQPEMAYDFSEDHLGDDQTIEQQPSESSHHVPTPCIALQRLVEMTQGYSFSDLAAVCKEAALQPVVDLMMCTEGDRDVVPSSLRLLHMSDFEIALQRVKPPAVDQANAVEMS